MTSNSILSGFSFQATSDFAHFRNPFTQSFFETFIAPPRTTVTGLLAAAMGYDESAAIEYSKRVMIGAKVEEIRGFASDLTTIVNLKKPPEKTPVMRQLLVSPRFRLYVASKDEKLLRNTSKALEAPMYTLYLGISECLAKVSGISSIEELKSGKAKLLSCIVPLTKKLKYKVRLPTNPKNEVYPPRIYRTIRFFDRERRGRNPSAFIDLLMFYNCQIELNKEIPTSVFQDEHVCLF
jgi:CRISPR-associated protein Cas5 subtype I-B